MDFQRKTFVFKLKKKRKSNIHGKRCMYSERMFSKNNNKMKLPLPDSPKHQSSHHRPLMDMTPRELLFVIVDRV